MKKAGLLLAVTILAAGAAGAQGSGAPVFPPFGFDMSAMDRSSRPGDDFFRYANGDYLARTEIPADRPIACAFEMTDRTDRQLKTLLEEASSGVGEQPTDLRARSAPSTRRSWIRRRSSASARAQSRPSSTRSATPRPRRRSPA